MMMTSDAVVCMTFALVMVSTFAPLFTATTVDYSYADLADKASALACVLQKASAMPGYESTSVEANYYGLPVQCVIAESGEDGMDAISKLHDGFESAGAAIDDIVSDFAMGYAYLNGYVAIRDTGGGELGCWDINSGPAAYAASVRQVARITAPVLFNPHEGADGVMYYMEVELWVGAEA